QARLLPIGNITPNPFQPRREFSEEDLAKLTASMRDNGLLQPIVVRPGAEGSGGWELVAGERRWRAAMRLGWREIQAMVRDIDDRTMLVLALVENLQRSGLAPLEEAEGYRRLADEFGLSQAQVAEVVGRDRSTIANALRLLQLPASVRQLLADGALTAGHCRALLGLGDARRLAEVARTAVEKGWSVRDVEGFVQKARGSRRRKAEKAPREAAERALEEELQRHLGTAVRIRRTRGNTGRIEIPFYGPEDFERVFELVSGKSTAEFVS
ncbi:MAG: ParB/RepB/Spo0J family partition protein, partial [Gemmatimonadetes bacterium]|nr:ParB/RepB/Spo0J family partition protein [Gemmatimonadota bacterium]